MGASNANNPAPTAAPAADLGAMRQLSENRLKTSWELIFEKYGRSFEDEADEIDVLTGEIVVDKGCLKNTPNRPFGRMLDGESDSGDSEEEEEEGEGSNTDASLSRPHSHASHIASGIADKKHRMLKVKKLSINDLDAEMFPVPHNNA
ncbi:hypothetical protein HDU98_003699 [Podochytrium sp. JEL0797]|nr:hypothetical protein HDU98_003699 [Podochytrium sp. JEL0797]